MAAVAAADSLTANGSVLGPWDVALGDVAAGTLRGWVLLERRENAHVATIAATTTTAAAIVANSQARCVRLGRVDVLAMSLTSLLTTPTDAGVDLDVLRMRLVARESLEVCWSAAGCWMRSSVPGLTLGVGTGVGVVDRVGSAVEFGILGPLEAASGDGLLEVRGAKCRALLAVLLAHANRVVPSDRLVEYVWDGAPPESAAATLQTYVYRLRKSLPPGMLLTRPAGYVLEVPPGDLDALRFEHALDEVRQRQDAPPDWVAARLGEALAWWRGPALADFNDMAWAQPEAARLEGLRLGAVEMLIEARLALGEHAALVPDLERLVAEHPLREGLWAQLMLALYRSDRQADALRTFGRLRRHLGEELGIEPSKELARLEEAILLQKPELDGKAPDETSRRAVELPSGVVTFLLTDIVSSTPMWEQHPKTMADTVARHDELLYAAVTAHGGTVLKARGEGDSIFSVFARATDALDAALSAQQAMVSEPWPESTPLSVRMALHTGEAFERDGDYYGPTVNRAARIRGLAAGGQILLSHSTGELVRDDLPEQATLIDLGSHVLSDLARAERISGVGAPGLLESAALGAEALEGPAGVVVPVPGVLRDAAGELFVGRGPELEALMRAWKDASVGERRVVLIGGEPGVGKTRLAAELASIAASEDANVLYGRCDEDLGIPYQPWVEVVRHVIAHESREFLVEHIARYGRELSHLVPDLAQCVGDLSAASPGDPDAERYLLFSAVAGFIARLCSDNPVLLVLEDLHWADKPTLLLLRHLIGATDSSRLLVLGTYRPTDLGAEHPLADVLAVLRREERVRRVDLHGLNDAEVVALLEAAAGHSLDDQGAVLAQALYRETDGNPFFTREILRHLAETGAISQRADGRWIAEVDFRGHGSLPTSVREVIGRRVARLGGETAQCLRAAAVIGRDFDLDLLAGVIDHSEEHVLDLLDGAIGAVLIREVSQRPGRMSFAHALIEHTLYDDLGPARRQRLHLRVAAALDALYGDDPGDRLGELAYHWAQASQPADAARAAEYALRAGDQALAKLAPDDAVRWYGQALELIDSQPVPDELARCEALVGLGTAQRHAGDPRSRETLLGAADLAQRLGSPTLLVRAALANNRGRVSRLGAIDQDRIDTLEAALAATVGTGTPERAMLLATLGAELTWGDPQRARALSDEALIMARRVDDDLTRWEVLNRRTPTIWSPATLDERTANLYEQLEVAERLGERYFRAGAAGHLVEVATCRGDLVEVDKNLDVMIRVAEETGLTYLRGWTATQFAWRRLLAGQIDEAEQAADEALRVAHGEPDAFAYYAGQIYAIRRAQGRLGEIIELLEQTVSENPGVSAFRAALASALCEVDRLDDARMVFQPLVASDFTEFPFNASWLTAMTLSADTAADLEHRAAALILATLLAPWRDQFAYTGITCEGSVARPLGLALATAGRLDEADEAFAQAAAVHERIDAPIELARTQVDWARMLASRGAPDDADRARALLRPTLTTASNLGLATIQRQAQTLLSTLAAN
jgi:DNA-binding SARP family transcriptional activator/tetratricopeptide (TPR) repeat protein